MQHSILATLESNLSSSSSWLCLCPSNKLLVRGSMDMMMTSNSSKASNNSSAATSAHQHQQEAIGMMPQVVEAKNVKQARKQAATSEERKPRPQLDEELRCPRCDSSNTKFCYYNNYSTLQPHYFCKACRRYWTHGGSLRNVPVGGRCRKNKCTSASVSSLLLSSSNFINEQLQQHLVVPASSTVEPHDFPNVLPTFMSTSFELPRTHLPPFTPMSLSSLEPAPPLPSGAGMTFLDMLGGGFLDHHQGSNDFYGPPTSNGMETLSSFGFNDFDMQHGINAAPISGGGATHEGGQWPTTQVGAANQQEGASVLDTARAK